MVLRPNPLPTASRRSARTISHRQPIRTLRRHDSRALRDRIPGLQRRSRTGRPISSATSLRRSTKRRGLYAPYQPRFDWNLWFASLGDWRQNQIVPLTEEKLLANDAAVLHLFRANPFPKLAAALRPRHALAILVHLNDEKHRTGNWWRRNAARPIRTYLDVWPRWQDHSRGSARRTSIAPVVVRHVNSEGSAQRHGTLAPPMTTADPAQTAAPVQPDDLPRVLGVSHATAIVVGTIIGSGIFLVPRK